MSWFGWHKKPKKPARNAGTERGVAHRGIGIGSTKNPDLSPENVAKWQTLTGEEVDGFLYDEQPLEVHSTNVKMIQYHHEIQSMMVEFKGGEAYMYSNVSEDEAMRVLQAQSKGAIIWDLFRVRGSATAHRKPFRRLR